MSQCFARAFVKQSVNSAQLKIVTMHGRHQMLTLLSFCQDHIPSRSPQLETASCSGRGLVVYHMGGALDAHDIAAPSVNVLLQHVILPMSCNISYVCYPCFG